MTDRHPASQQSTAAALVNISSDAGMTVNKTYQSQPTIIISASRAMRLSIYCFIHPYQAAAGSPAVQSPAHIKAP
jgi:hypothetical protein